MTSPAFCLYCRRREKTDSLRPNAHQSNILPLFRRLARYLPTSRPFSRFSRPEPRMTIGTGKAVYVVRLRLFWDLRVLCTSTVGFDTDRRVVKQKPKRDRLSEARSQSRRWRCLYVRRVPCTIPRSRGIRLGKRQQGHCCQVSFPLPCYSSVASLRVSCSHLSILFLPKGSVLLKRSRQKTAVYVKPSNPVVSLGVM